MDPIANMLIQIKNAGQAKHPSVVVPYSHIKFNIATLLQREGYVSAVAKKGKGVRQFLEIGIVYSGKRPRINGVRRVSKPSRRSYVAVKDIVPVRQGYGTAILSTPKGILTGKDARKEHVGGELLFTIW